MRTQQICAFETWINGGLQVSSFYVGGEAIDFIESHYKSGTFADIHIFEDVKFGRKEYDALAKLSKPIRVTIQDIQSGDVQVVDIDWVLSEINRDRSNKWTDYDESDWQEGWNEWCEGDIYKIINIE